MPGPHILVGFAQEVQRDRLLALQLIDDLRNAGNNVTLLASAEGTIEENQFIQTLNQQLAACEYVLVVLSPEALNSTKVHMIVDTALNLVVRQRLRGVLVLLAAPIDAQEMPPTWTTIRVFDATQDYARAFARLQLVLTPITAKVQPVPRVPQSLSPTPKASPPSVAPLISDGVPILLVPKRLHKMLQLPTRRWFLPLVFACILVLVVCLLSYTTYALLKKTPSSSDQQTPYSASSPITLPSATPTSTTILNTPQGLYTSVMQNQPILVDRFNTPDDTHWDMSQPDDQGRCQLVDGAYDVAATKVQSRQICTLQNTTFQNFAFQSQLSFVSGPGPCGFIVRMQGRNVDLSYRLYYFANGDLELKGPKNVSGNITTLINRTFAYAPTQRVTLTLIALNDTFYVYVNGQFIASAKDATFTSGVLGFICNDTPKPTETHFMNAKIWSL